MRNYRKWISGIVVFLLNIIMIFLLLVCFIFFLAPHNKHLLRFSRIFSIIVITFPVMYAAFARMFGGYSIGVEKSRSIIFSLSMRALITDVITYVEYLIMSYNSVFRNTLAPKDGEILSLFYAFCAQVAIIAVMVLLGNFLFFKIQPAERCCLITSSSEELKHVIPKIRKYARRYEIHTIVDYRDPDVLSKMQDYETIFISGVPSDQRVRLVEYGYHLNKNIYFSSEINDVVTRYARVLVLDDLPFMEVLSDRMRIEQRIIKRLVDIVLSAIGLIVASPIMLVCAVAIKLCDGGPILYRQDRVTGGNRVFSICKFRTMYEASGNDFRSANVDDDRITPVGRIIRKTRMDELPQLINIIRGDMSLVGPRPEMVSNVQKYLGELPEFNYRTRMKAGLTGIAQIEGKYNTSPRDKLILDLMYIENYSVWLDFKLMINTLKVFFKKDSAEGFHSEDYPELDKYRFIADEIEKSTAEESPGASA